MPHYLKPHSSEWFAALSKFDPQQAAHTQQIIALAGSSDVCSVCGDKPAHDYQILKIKFPDGAVATTRLCDDCRGIRQGLHEEDFIPFKSGEESKKNN